MKLRYLLMILCVGSLSSSITKATTKGRVINPVFTTPSAIATFAGVVIINDSKKGITNGTSAIKAGEVGFLPAKNIVQGSWGGGKGILIYYDLIHLKLVGSLSKGSPFCVGIGDYYGSSYTTQLVFNRKNYSAKKYSAEKYSADYFRSNDVFIWAPVIKISKTRDPTVTHLIKLNSSDFKQYVKGAPRLTNSHGASKAQVSNRTSLATVLKSSVAVVLPKIKKPKAKRP